LITLFPPFFGILNFVDTSVTIMRCFHFILFAFVASCNSFFFNYKAIKQYQKSNVITSSIDEVVERASNSALQQLIVRFDCDEINSDEISECLYELGTLSVSVEVESEKPVLNDESNWNDLIKTKSWQTAILKASFPASFDKNTLKEILFDTYPDNKLVVEFAEVEDKDWITHVQKSWKPLLIGNLTVLLPWHENEIKQKNENSLLLEGGAAFGTGDHPTTVLCCEWLQRIVPTIVENSKQPSSSEELSVLDYGCGSAILALAALKFGATKAVGVDIDKDALVSAKNNCKLNSQHVDLYVALNNGEPADLSCEEQSIVSNQLKGFQHNDFFESTEQISEQQFDVVVANILAPILISLAPKLFSHTKPSGFIGLSGVVASQAKLVVETYSKYFDDVEVEKKMNDWVLITGQRKNK
jgi:ribosomal protein L11 methyltransferase